jgi:hypothetical protein
MVTIIFEVVWVLHASGSFSHFVCDGWKEPKTDTWRFSIVHHQQVHDSKIFARTSRMGLLCGTEKVPTHAPSPTIKIPPAAAAELAEDTTSSDTETAASSSAITFALCSYLFVHLGTTTTDKV